LTNLVEVYDALVGGPLAFTTPEARGDLLARLVRRGLTDLRERGLTDAAKPLIAHLDEAFATRLAQTTARSLGIQAALRELGR
jgi:hypothetical protein